MSKPSFWRRSRRWLLIALTGLVAVAGETLKRLATSRTDNPRPRVCTSANRADSPSLALR